jgi:VWFA-related protein
MRGSLAVVVLSIWSLVPAVSFAQAASPETAGGAVAGNAVKPAASTTTQQTSAPSTESEISTYETDTALKVRVNLVLVRVVVRDSAGNPVGSLRKEDFQLADNGKPQNISTFAIETPESHAVTPATTESDSESSTPTPGVANANGSAAKVAAFPQRFVALVFDDVHLLLQDALAVRNAAMRLTGALSPSDRVAIYATSGQVTQDFTDDRAVVEKTLQGIVPRPGRGESVHECPDLSYYQADLIENKRDPQALAAAADEAKTNCGLGSGDVQVAARRVLSIADADTLDVYRGLESVVRHLANMPGQRVMVLVSSGFILGQQVQSGIWDVIDRATRSGIVINTIDARGLYTADPLGDIAAPPQQPPNKPPMQEPREKTQVDWQGAQATYRVQAQLEQGAVLQGVAASTGGTYFHNRNDLDAGIRQALAAPAVSYLLGFSPQNLKIDGRFHTLKVSIANGQKYKIQARNGYFAPKTIADPKEMAKQEVMEALFSQDEILDLPVELKTQFFKVDAASARLTVFTHLGLKGVHFRKLDGRNNNNITIATAIFNENGQFVTGEMKEMALRLKDATFEHLNQSGFTIKVGFDVKPGTYIVRTVVRGAEGPQLTARNGTAVVPD